MPNGRPRLRQLAAILAISSAIFVGADLKGQAGERKTGVVELFTSQGCSSCPPADLYLGELAKRKELLALTLPVDYWDFLGWKDTLASPAFTKRQRAYAQSRQDRNVYTPQMVINGRVHAIGSDRKEVEAFLLATQDDFAAMAVDIDLTLDGNRLKINIGGRAAGNSAAEATIWLVLYNRSEKVKIGRGENTGRMITYSNVVRELVPIGMWSGEAMEISLPRKDLLQQGYDGCAVIVQAGATGPIYGAASIESWPED
ncbi:hypothetical protein that often co-occurs with aconitase [hydrothermal vent metagenome]|uniref:DUF1223 domain-containing protein n=1 Tax=hydrothermal vent metagenome TaxID=652676 RepID=A0A3B0S4S2_9ZZZZ